MEHGGRLLANCALTVFYLPVYPPHSDYNYGITGVDSSPQKQRRMDGKWACLLSPLILLTDGLLNFFHLLKIRQPSNFRLFG